jgi:MFS transporter, YNFM family, putative membrane transport protein
VRPRNRSRKPHVSTTTAPSSAPIAATTQRSILLLSFATFSSMVAQRICDAMLPELSRSFDASLAQAAQVVSMFAIVYGVAQLVYGPLGDRLGKFRIVAWATLGCGVGSALAVFAGSLNLLVLARMATGLAAAAIIPLSMAWIGDNVRFDQLQETLARVGLGTTLGIGGGQLIGGLMTNTLGWRWAFVVLALLFGAVGALLLKDWHGQKSAQGPGAEAPAESAPAASLFAQTLPILTGRWSRIVLLVAFAEGAAGFGALAMWATHLHRALHLSLFGAGAIVALFGLGGMAYMASARRLIARLGQQGLTAAGGSMMGLSALVVAFTPWWPLAVPASLLAGFGFFMFHNTMQANAAHMAPRARGTGVSLFAAALFLGQSVGAMVAAGLIDRLGSAMVVALGGGAIAALGLWFGRALRQHHAREAAAR